MPTIGTKTDGREIGATMTDKSQIKHDLGPYTAACWTRRKSDDDISIRFWTGYSWLEFGRADHLGPDTCEALSGLLEYEVDRS